MPPRGSPKNLTKVTGPPEAIAMISPADKVAEEPNAALAMKLLVDQEEQAVIGAPVPRDAERAQGEAPAVKAEDADARIVAAPEPVGIHVNVVPNPRPNRS